MDLRKKQHPNTRPSRWHKAAIVAALAAAMMTAAPAMALCGGIVFDPSNFVEHIFEVSAALQRIARMESQLQNQERMLASLGTNAWPGMAQSMQALVLQNGGRFASADPAGQMATNEPLSFGNGTPDASQIDTLRTAWDRDNRDGIFQNRQLVFRSSQLRQNADIQVRQHRLLLPQLLLEKRDFLIGLGHLLNILGINGWIKDDSKTPRGLWRCHKQRASH